MPDNRLFEYMGHWLVRRPDTPNYHIYWLQGSRRVRRKSARTSDLETAKQRLIGFARRQARPRHTEPDDVMLLDCLSDHLERSAKGKPSEKQARLSMRHLARFFELESLTTVADLTLDAQDRYIEWRRRTGEGKRGQLSDATIARELAVLRVSLSNARKRGVLTSAPFVRGLPPPPPRQRFLKANEVLRLLDACTEPYLHLYVLIAMHTLQRPGAILGLTVKQVQLETRRIDFLPDGVVQSHKRKPVVPITRTLLPHLERAVGQSRSGYVIEYNGESVLSIRKSFKSACDRAGLEGVMPYTLRHTGATLLAAAGVPMRQIAGMMGHTTQRVTELYAKHSPDFLQDAANALDDLFPARTRPNPPPVPGGSTRGAPAGIIHLDIAPRAVARIQDAADQTH